MLLVFQHILSLIMVSFDFLWLGYKFQYVVNQMWVFDSNQSTWISFDTINTQICKQSYSYVQENCCLKKVMIFFWLVFYTLTVKLKNRKLFYLPPFYLQKQHVEIETYWLNDSWIIALKPLVGKPWNLLEMIFFSSGKCPKIGVTFFSDHLTTAYYFSNYKFRS